MKTKHILTALALPAMFAACTAEDIVSESNGLQQQDQRAKLSKDFVLNVNGEVESRYAVEGTTGLKFTFEEGDLIGANLIDSYEAGDNFLTTGAGYTNDKFTFNADDPSTWKIVPYVAPALPFENKSGVWTSAGELGVGNYLFTNPYSPKDKNRTAASYELPIVIQYDSKNPNAHIEAYNKAVAAAVLYEGDTEANISLKNLFTYPKIVVNFPSNAEVSKVTKVILKREGEFIYKGALNHQAVVEMFNEDVIEAWLENPANKDKTVEDYWNTKSTSEFVIDGTEPVAKDGVKFAEVLKTPVFIYEMNEALVANSFEVRLMLPSVSDLYDIVHEAVEDNDETTGTDETTPRSADAVTMFICTDNGNFKFDLTNPASYTFKNTTLIDKKAVALARNKSNTLSVNKNALSAATAGEVDELLSGNLVSTVADWNALVEKYGDLKKYAKDYTGSDQDDLIVKILGDKFTLTSDLKMPEVAEFIIQTDVKVEGDVTLKNITIQDSNSSDSKVPAVTVMEGSTLTTDQTFVAPVVNVEEGAELIFTAAYDKKNKLIAYTGVTTVNNEGTVTVPAGVNATFSLNNKFKASELNVGEAAVAARATAVAVANLNGGYNYGVISNNGEINVKSYFYNWAPAEKNGSEKTGYVYDDEAEEWNGVPTIKNEGTFNVKATMYNYGLVEQNGTLSSKYSDGSFNNYANMTVKAGVETYIDSNAELNTDGSVKKNGEIILSEKNPTNFTIHGAKGNENYGVAKSGYVKYAATAAELATLDLSSSPVTYLIANGDVNLTKTFTYTAEGATTATVKTLAVLEVHNGDVKVAGSTATAGAPAQVGKLIIASGKATISSKVNSVGTIEIADNASLEIVEGSGDLTIASISNVKIYNTTLEEGAERGKLYVNGEMTTSDVKSQNTIPTADIPTHIKPGKGVTIACAKETDTSKEDSMEAAVELWASKWYTLAQYDQGYYLYNPYGIAEFVNTMDVWEEGGDAAEKQVAADLKSAFGIDGTEGKRWNDKMYQNDERTAVEEFTDAVNAYLAAVENADEESGATLATALFINETTSAFNDTKMTFDDATYYESVEDAYDTVRRYLATNGVTDNASAIEKATAWLLTDAQISTAMSKNEASKYWFIWAGCDMEGLVDIWSYYSIEGRATYYGGDCAYYTGCTNRSGAEVVKWAKYIKDLTEENLKGKNGYYKEAQGLLSSYTFQDLDKKYIGFSAMQVKALVEKGE